MEAMVLRTKPEANQWLHLNPRVAALGADAFEQGAVMITKIHTYLLKEVNLAENAGEKTAEFVNIMCQITLETFWTREVKGQEGFERTDSMLEGLGAGWTASFLAKFTRKRRRIEASARVPFLGTLPEEEWEVHHRDHESRTGCKLDRVAFKEEVWTVVQSYGTQSILKTGLNQPLMREVLDKLDDCEGRLRELLIDSATDESEANSPIKMTPQDDKGEVVYLSRTRRGTMRSKLVIDKINAMKMKLGSRVMPRRVGKTKVDSEISMKSGNSAKRKRVEEVMDLGQGDYQLSGTDKMLTDIAMVPPILMAGIKSTGYKSKRSDRTLTGATLEMEILSQCGESTMKDFKPSPMIHGKGNVAGQLIPVEYNRLTVSETVSIDEFIGGYMEMLEYRNSARGYVMALEDGKAMEGYLETMVQGTTLKQKA